MTRLIFICALHDYFVGRPPGRPAALAAVERTNGLPIALWKMMTDINDPSMRVRFNMEQKFDDDRLKAIAMGYFRQNSAALSEQI